MSTATTIKVDAGQFSGSELNSVAKALGALPANSPLRGVLQALIDAGHRGVSLTVLAQDAELSPNEAAAALGISRPHLLKFIRSGVLRARRVGTHQRITYEDFMDFKSRYDNASKDVATALANGSTLGQQITLTDEEMAELDSL